MFSVSRPIDVVVLKCLGNGDERDTMGVKDLDQLGEVRQ
jgi:hypothetical protein